MNFISVMEIIGTVAFAVSGALVAIDKKLDYYGILFLAIITAVGGGIVRDVIISLPLPLALENPLYVIISIVSAICVILFYKWVNKLQSLINIFDAVVFHVKACAQLQQGGNSAVYLHSAARLM